MLTFYLSYGGGTCAITPRKTRNIIRLLRPTPIQTFRVGGCTLPRARAAPRPVEDVLHVTSRRVTNKLPLLKPYSTSTDGFSACVCRVCASACSCWTLRKPACAVRADLRVDDDGLRERDSSVESSHLRHFSIGWSGALVP